MKKSLLILMLFITSITFSQSKFRTTILDTGAVQVNAGFTSINFLNVFLNGTGQCYVKFYDKRTKPIIASDAPVFTLQILNSSTVRQIYLYPFTKINFTNGLWIRTSNGNQDTSTVLPTNKATVELQY